MGLEIPNIQKIYGAMKTMHASTGGVGSMDILERKRYLEIKEVRGSSEPMKVALKRNGVFLGSFKNATLMDEFILQIPLATLKPAKSTRKSR